MANSTRPEPSIFEAARLRVMEMKAELEVWQMLDGLEANARMLSWACGKPKAAQSVVAIGQRDIKVQCIDCGTRRKYFIDYKPTGEKETAANQLYSMLGITAIN